MNKEFCVKISNEEENERLDNFLSAYLCDFSRNKIQKFITDKNVLVNGSAKKNSYKTREDDVITIKIEEEQNVIIEPQAIELDIRYEDENMLVVNKPSNMLTHPTVQETKNTLVNALLYHTKGVLSDINGDMRPGILHRLDRNTSGLIMTAKSNAAHEHLANQIKNQTVIKKYLAVVHGKIQADEGTINEPVGRNPSQPQKMAVVLGGKPSVTKFKVLERFTNNTFLELTLVTGRTHQIRVHLASIGHPIVNDSLYTGHKFKVNTTEQVLQSYDLTFSTLMNNIINIKIEPDEDIQKVLRYLRSKL